MCVRGWEGRVKLLMCALRNACPLVSEQFISLLREFEHLNGTRYMPGLLRYVLDSRPSPTHTSVFERNQNRSDTCAKTVCPHPSRYETLDPKGDATDPGNRLLIDLKTDRDPEWPAKTIRTSGVVREDAPRMHAESGCYNHNWYTDLPPGTGGDPFGDGGHSTVQGNGGKGMYVWPTPTPPSVPPGSHGAAQDLYMTLPARVGQNLGEDAGTRECMNPRERLTRVVHVREREYVVPNVGYQGTFMLPRHMLAPLVEDKSWYSPCRPHHR